MELVVINGVNLNMLGKREPKQYGKTDLKVLIKQLKDLCKSNEIDLIDFQSNCEGEIINFIHSLMLKKNKIKGIIINPGAFTHTSIALRDALLAVDIAFVEVHITNIYQREPFRHKSYLRDIAVGCVIGLGIEGYKLAVKYFLSKEKG